ncbi:response regulator transcription factor [Rhodococcus antarcticus]|uniref:Response regulator transcription factor n=1 Tax=Rhodococcus antarcticus TaxID=2987751 RepID=A0ABY6P2A6_9NOCA|nr:response regulator transcription factor [Rhodococcus antarcticus]UZJ25780.1 response regulator transcription factor [Rhodococcus antarcticus]
MRVLLVEDEVSLAETIRRGLDAEGWVVEVATDGEQGLRLGSDHPYDVIVLDIMLPRLNGYDVLKGLRRRQVWTPVLMLTAKDGEFDQTDAFDLGADDYLIKPFSFAVLVARLRALQRRGAPTRPVVLTSGDITLDPARRRVHQGGVEVEMTRREYGLLEFMLRHQGIVVSKAEILAGVWDTHYDGDDNIVEVYVGYLRRKFGATTIETLRGRGYRWRDGD